MAAASLVATAFGIILILITAYILAAGIIGLATSVAEAQKEVTALSIKTSGTSIEMMDHSGNNPLYLNITNTGSEQIDYSNMDVYLKVADAPPEYYRYKPDGSRGWKRSDSDIIQNSINPDNINPGAWDPGETLNITVTADGSSYIHVLVVTPVGVSDSKYL
ncbi:hypothetical protein ASZ90_016140 [hydrocarbon metagenome]|uniref:Flagellin flab1 n=1 Tax=hydrocarbon metagenome TaxID=938273 RepID=A0A0W8F0G3_9ZZZZ